MTSKLCRVGVGGVENSFHEPSVCNDTMIL